MSLAKTRSPLRLPKTHVRTVRGRALIQSAAEYPAAERRTTMHRLQSRALGIALGGTAFGGLIVG
jgi:hypothetical protein